ncbi:hypothetical protein JET14_06005 [Martelella lutilitoris]|uniref:Uncharacterized protein n=1 Tax=Martelella lutilitoris TaxID=2583532 RepID=A0A7T7HM26_9HYPH|nr:hypothetical protein [Martelella lutilitoris]QQM31721.1 hypothetical protein JET14_06005 [Martelella lutilitoris]
MDTFKSYSSGVTAPASHAAEVTPGAEALSVATRALFVGGRGDLELTMLGGETVKLVGVEPGYHPLRVTHVLSATTATDIVALW